jgi:hypothetical protein
LSVKIYNFKFTFFLFLPFRTLGTQWSQKRKSHCKIWIHENSSNVEVPSKEKKKRRAW